MSSDSRDQREKLKNEYKKHYRKMREAREQLNRRRKTHNISQALKNMDTTELMESFDSFLFEVKDKITFAEARLDVALEHLGGKGHASGSSDEQKETLDKANARETLKLLKIEMGQLYSEIEQQAASMQSEKTIGPPPQSKKTPDS